MVTGLADWLAAPPAVYAHLPIGAVRHKGNDTLGGGAVNQIGSKLGLDPSTTGKVVSAAIRFW
jgi:hypothetical protein